MDNQPVLYRIALLEGKLKQLNQKLDLLLANQEKLIKILGKNKSDECLQLKN